MECLIHSHFPTKKQPPRKYSKQTVNLKWIREKGSLIHSKCAEYIVNSKFIREIGSEII